MSIKQQNAIIACNRRRNAGICFYASFDPLFELGILRCTKNLGDCTLCHQLVIDKYEQRKKYEDANKK